MNVQIISNRYELANVAAELFIAKSNEAVKRRGFFTVALPGGSTPKRLFQLLADPNARFRDRVPWPSIRFFWTDERHVPPDHWESNYRMANEVMLKHVPVSSVNVHRVMSENPNAAEAAEDYERTIPQFVPGNELDLIMLGIGADGHTASIFPDSEVLDETKRLVAAPWIEKLMSYRITMTLPLINNAAAVVFLVSGSEKAEIVSEILKESKSYPAQEVRPANCEPMWLLDREAASKI